MPNFTTTDEIAIVGIITTTIIGVVSWFVSAFNEKRKAERKELHYRIKMTPLMDKKKFKDVENLMIQYKEDIIDELVLLEVDIYNAGNTCIENPPIRIESKETTYVIPAYIDDVPDGYDDLWELERIDGEACNIKVNHINPGQTLKARFLLDEMPKKLPVFICPMPNVKVIPEKELKMSPFILHILKQMYPSLSQAINVISSR
jgi:hypothetical protein